MAEQTELLTGTPDPATAAPDSGYGDVFKPSGDQEAPKVLPSETQKTPSKEVLPSAPDPEIVLEIGGKEITGKQSELLHILEDFNRIKEKEKSLNRDYTQKTQVLAEQRKSIEAAFGRMPEPQEIQSLGKLWQAYFSNERARQVIDAVLTDSVDSILQGTSNQGTQNPQDTYTKGLEQKIHALESKLDQFTNSIEAREESKVKGESERIWSGWVETQKGKGIEITEDIDTAMAPFIDALSQRYPDWDDSKVLDEAYRHATIDQADSKAAAKILSDADKAKGAKPPRITPKFPERPDSELSYAELAKKYAKQ